MREKAMREISVLRRIGDVANPRPRGDNVVTMLDYFEDKRRKAIYIVFPLYDCSLADIIPASTDDQMVRFHGRDSFLRSQDRSICGKIFGNVILKAR